MATADGHCPAEVVKQLACDILALFIETEARPLADIARCARVRREVPAWAAEKISLLRELRLAIERVTTLL
ncbi:hypothetical protein LCL61_29325 [Amycolatopsis coloradensis]|uniref:Uncharacterized protein n=1 Tax=Amycolatopsis coloradensis TaxID=76021 RepID=A0ACD5BJP0_9PSEU